PSRPKTASAPSGAATFIVPSTRLFAGSRLLSQMAGSSGSFGRASVAIAGATAAIDNRATGVGGGDVPSKARPLHATAAINTTNSHTPPRAIGNAPLEAGFACREARRTTSCTTRPRSAVELQYKVRSPAIVLVLSGRFSTP